MPEERLCLTPGDIVRRWLSTRLPAKGSAASRARRLAFAPTEGGGQTTRYASGSIVWPREPRLNAPDMRGKPTPMMAASRVAKVTS